MSLNTDVYRARKRGEGKPKRRFIAGLTSAALLAAGLTVVAAPQAAVAADNLQCIDTIYLASNESTGTVNKIRSINLTTEVTSSTNSFPLGAGNYSNQIGVGAKGASATYGTSSSIVHYTASTGTTASFPKPTGVTNGTVGAVNPATGRYYYGSYGSGANANRLTLYTFNPADSSVQAAPVVVVTLDAAPANGANGDIAFDKTGRLYLVNSSTVEYRLYVASGVIPTSGTGNTMTASELTRGTADLGGSAANGIAFASDGYLYLGSNTRLQRSNPITGLAEGDQIPLTGVASTDLGTCANPSTTEVESTFPGGKANPNDSTTIVVEGGSYGPDAEDPDFPASSPNPDGSTSTDPGIVLPGETYTVVQQPAPGTNLDPYDTTWICRDSEGNPIPGASGTGNTATFTVPTGTDGTSITCTFENTLVQPAGVPDSATVIYGTDLITLPGSTDDTPGNGEILHNLTVITTAGATNGGKTLTTPQGTWQVLTDGQITFAPVDGYVGTPPSIGYRFTDEFGLTGTSTATVTVRPGPSALPDTESTTQGVPVEVSPLSGDTPGINVDGTSATIPTNSLLFATTGQPTGSVLSDDRRTLTVAGEGEYVINAASGVVTFTPEATFFGAASSVPYVFTDSTGNSSGSTITITVTAVNPVALPDAENTPFRTPVTVDVIDNDSAGPGGEIDPSLTVITTAGATDGGKTLVTEQGTWTVNEDGTITFTPADDFVGTTPAIDYQITDENGQSASSTVEVTVRPGPTATDDEDVTDQNVDVTFPILGNDVPGLQASGAAGSFDADSVRFVLTDDLPEGSTVSSDGRTITVPGEGVYTFDPSTEEVTFDPEAQFTGPATPITYEVTDQADNTTSATITITVNAITPTTVDDAAKTPGNTPVTIDPLENDTPGAAGVPLVPGSVVFTSPDAEEDGKKLVTDEGEWTIDDDGVIRFVPAPDFEGVTPPVEYEVKDTNGTPVRGEVTITVGSAAVAVPDGDTTLQGQPVAVPLLVNDTPSDLGNPCDDGETDVPAGCDTGELLPATVIFPDAGQPAGSVIHNEGRALTVPGQGTYVIDETNGDVTFTPELTFAGEATPVVYQVSDSHGATVSSTVTITVIAVTPVAEDDTRNTVFQTPVTIELLENDEPGAEIVPLVPARTVFPEADQPEGVTVSEDGKTLTIPGQGVYVIDENGAAVFTPAEGYSGTTTAVTYRIEDENGTQSEASVQVTVRPGPTALVDGDTTLQGIAVTVSPLRNDTPSRNADDSAGEWDASTLVFPESGQPEGATVSEDGKTLTVPGEGVYTIDESGEVTFQPEPAFSGTASTVSYVVTDANNNSAGSTITIIVTGVTPTAENNTASTPYATPVTFDFAGNDEPGDPEVPLVIESAVFGPESIPAGIPGVISEDGKTLELSGQGTFQLHDDGTVTFTPAEGFSGTTTPVQYTIADVNGTTATANLSVTVQPGPQAEDDVDRTPQNTPVTVNVLGNDRAGFTAEGTFGRFELASVVFPVDAQSVGTVGDEGKTLTVPGEGVYTIDPVTGEITFTPEPQFRGVATPVVYAVTDSLGNIASATVTITVAGVDPIARDNAAFTTPGTPVTIDVLANDNGADGVPLDPTTLALVDGNGDLVTELVVPGEGTWTVVDGKIVFSPLPGFTGVTTPVTYSVADINGTRVTATVTVTVEALATTGGDVPWVPLGGALALLLAGLALMALRRYRNA